MLRRIDRIILRVPHLASAVKYYREVLGLSLVKEDQRLACLRFPDQDTQVVLHSDPDLPAEATYYLVENVRDLFARRVELKLNFIQAPTPVTRGYRAAIRDPFGNVLLLVDRTSEAAGAAVVEDAKAPGMLFPGIEEKAPVKRESLVRIYEAIGRTADDLPYTMEFEKLYAMYAAEHRENPPTREDVWRQLLNLRKAAKLPKMGEARSRPPDAGPEERERLRRMLGEDIGRRDRLPYTDRFNGLVDEFNKGLARRLTPHQVWRLVATLAK